VRYEGFLRITQSRRFVTQEHSSTEGSKGVPAYRAVHLMSSKFLIKAPTRQMLYPLSYRGICLERRCYHAANCRGQIVGGFTQNKRPPTRGDLLLVKKLLSYAAWVCSAVSANTRRPFSASSMISLTAEVSGFTSMRSHARRWRMIPWVAISRATPVSFE
jgi:hypothetical protein